MNRLTDFAEDTNRDVKQCCCHPCWVEEALFKALRPYEHVVARMDIPKTLRMEYILLSTYHQLPNLPPLGSVNYEVTVDQLIHQFMSEIEMGEGENTEFKCPWFVPLRHLVPVENTYAPATMFQGAEVYAVQVIRNELSGTSCHDSSYGAHRCTGSSMYISTDNTPNIEAQISHPRMKELKFWENLDFPRHCSVGHIEDGLVISLTKQSALSFLEARRTSNLMMNSRAKLYGSEATGCCREHLQKGDVPRYNTSANLAEIVYD